MSDQIFDSISSACRTVFAPFLQWERLRHPWAGWARLVLAILFPFIIWSHNWLLIGLLFMAFFSHPYWFPVCVDAGEDRHVFTEMADYAQKWMKETDARDKFLAIFPGVVLFIPLIAALWNHSVFWTIYFLAALAVTKGMFLFRLFGERGNATST